MSAKPGKSLKKLIDLIPFCLKTSPKFGDCMIRGVKYDSRKIIPGDIYIALIGGNFDGHDFIKDAVNHGAAAIVGSKTGLSLEVPYLEVPDTRKALAYLSAAFYGFPGEKMVVIGVTGTDGKTTTANLIYQILITAGLNAGLISTINALIGDRVLDTGFHVTTPEAPDVQKYLSIMVEEGITHVVIETTSHGLAQDRVTGCSFDIGVVTNITHEHLDYHKSYEGYFSAKARLFEFLTESKPPLKSIEPLAVLNKDDGSFEKLDKIIQVKKVSYGVSQEADIVAKDIISTDEGLQFSVTGPGFTDVFQCPLLGEYNVANCLAAISTAVVGLGISVKNASRGISAIQDIPGRMERLEMGQDFTAIVDFAHTPNALESALKAARKLTDKRVIAIFGSAGLRDREKRRMMAKTSIDLADISILTAEDPRTESLSTILQEMANEANRSGGQEGINYWLVEDRGEAIRKGVKMAQPGDVVIACGKGHEQSMCFDLIEYAWDDRIAMKAALADLLHKNGPDMPYLPTQDQG